MAHLVASKPGVIELLDSILHVLMAQELHHPGAVLEGVREANISCLTHVVFQILEIITFYVETQKI